MTEKPGIIFLSPYLPAHDASGGARVIFDSIRFLHEAGYGVYLFSFCSDADSGRVSEAGKYCDGVFIERLKDYSTYPANTDMFRDSITSLCAQHKKLLLQCEYGFMVRYLPRVMSVPAVLREHEILSKSFYERSQSETNWFKKFLFIMRMVKKCSEEKRWYSCFDQIIVFTEQDKEYAAVRCSVKKISAIPLGIDTRAQAVLQPAVQSKIVLFIGNYSHSPNVDAALYFCNDILPRVKKSMPDTRVVLAGAYPVPEVMKLGNLRDVTVAGYVKEIDEHYASCALVVVPVRFGSGMRFKIIEAQAFGRPVVSTSLGARGVYGDGALLIADTADDFSSAVIRLLRDPDEAGALAKRGRAAVEKRHNLSAVMAAYEDVYRPLFQLGE